MSLTAGSGNCEKRRMNVFGVTPSLLHLLCCLTSVLPVCWAQTDLISSLDDTFKNERCEPLDATQVATCRDVGYNNTLLPNKLGHNTQKDAGLIANQYFPLIEVNCYDKLQFFVCAVYLPMCLTDYPQYIPPCRSICEKAKYNCEPLMQQFGFHWPEDLRCDKFPEKTTKDQLCAGNDTGFIPTARPPVLNTGGPNPRPVTTASTITFPTNGSLEIRCGQQHYYRSADRDTARYWVGVWAALCFISSLLVVMTYCIDRERFNYPERPVIFLAGCYCIFSFCYLVSLMMGDTIACRDGLAVQPGSAGPGCIIIAFLLYFSWMAAALWWVTLAFTWFLAASLKWAPEGIGKHFFKYHVFSWGVAVAQTLLLMALQKVDSDELTGACFVGYFDRDSLAAFVIGPLCVYLTVGALLFLYGFISLINIRSVIRQSGGGHHTDKLEKLMVRVAVFSILYAIPTAVALGCLFVEHSEKPSWKYPMDDTCDNMFPRPKHCLGEPAKPALFMLRLFMVLIVGLTSGIWIWSTKTLDAWRRRFGGKGSARQQYQATRIRSDSSATGAQSHVTSAMTSMTGIAPSIQTSSQASSGVPMHQAMRMYPQMQQPQYLPGGY